MPTTVNFPPDKPNDLGFRPTAAIEITWTPTRNRLDINGYYDGCVHIHGASMTLREFFDALGIDKRICDLAFKEKKTDGLSRYRRS
jgi:hypothetical protein